MKTKQEICMQGSSTPSYNAIKGTIESIFFTKVSDCFSVSINIHCPSESKLITIEYAYLSKEQLIDYIEKLNNEEEITIIRTTSFSLNI